MDKKYIFQANIFEAFVFSDFINSNNMPTIFTWMQRSIQAYQLESMIFCIQ